MDGQVRLHRFRYHLGKGFVDVGDNVLDIGCGQGYGTEILAETALNVLGIDLDEEQIKWNQDNIKLDNVRFQHGNLEKMELPKADVAVSFEVIEHLYKPHEFVQKLKAAVSKWIIISVPFGCEKLVEVNGDIQADLDSTHHAVFDRPEDVDKMFIDDVWTKFYDLRLGVTYLAIYYNKNK